MNTVMLKAVCLLVLTTIISAKPHGGRLGDKSREEDGQSKPPVCKIIPAITTVNVVEQPCPADFECLNAPENGALDRCNNTVFYCNVTADWQVTSEEEDVLEQGKELLKELCPCDDDHSGESSESGSHSGDRSRHGGHRSSSEEETTEGPEEAPEAAEARAAEEAPAQGESQEEGEEDASNGSSSESHSAERSGNSGSESRSR